MKIIFGFLLCLFCIKNAFSQQNNPQIRFLQSEIELGTLAQGDSAECFFEFENIGTYPLMLKEAYVTCGCTVAELPQIPLAPGEKDRLKVKIDTHDKFGKVRKVITIVSNALNSEEKIAVTFLVKENK